MASITPINIGSSPDDGTGDVLRSAFEKINANEQALNQDLADLGDLAQVDESDLPDVEADFRGVGSETLRAAFEAVSGVGSLPVSDTISLVADGTKQMRIDVGAVADATVRVLAMGNRDVDLAAGGTFAELAQGALADTALQPGDIASGTITARTGDIDLSGGSDGDLLTVQADGSLALETPPAAGTLASEAEAQAGEDNSKYMSSLRTAQAIAAQVGPLATEIAHNLAASTEPTVNDDGTQPEGTLKYGKGSLWPLADNLWYLADPSTGAAVWRKLIQEGKLAELNTASGNRLDFGVVTEVDVASGDATVDGEVASLIVRVIGDHGSSGRTLKITPAPGATTSGDFGERWLGIWNDTTGSGALSIADHADAAVDDEGSGQVAKSTIKWFRWAANDWVETPFVQPVGASSGAGITAQTDAVGAAVDDLTTLSAATHAWRNLNGTDDERRPIVLRNSDTQSDPVDILVPDGFASYVEGHVATDQTGAARVSVSRTLAYDGLTGTFDAGEDVTIGSATARIFADTGSVLTLVNIVGSISNDDTITGASSEATASADGTLSGTATINGATTIYLGQGASPAGASFWLLRIASGEFIIKGDIRGTVTVKGLIAEAASGDEAVITAKTTSAQAARFAWNYNSDTSQWNARVDSSGLTFRDATAGADRFSVAATTGAHYLHGGTLTGGALAINTVSGTLDSTHIGGRWTTSGAITVPTTPTGWWAIIVLGGDHDISFNSTTLDVSGQSWSTGDVLGVTVTSATTIAITRIAAASIVDQTDFSA